VALPQIILFLEKLKNQFLISNNFFPRKMKNLLKYSGIFYYTQKKSSELKKLFNRCAKATPVVPRKS
jgi:hypothetical protein